MDRLRVWGIGADHGGRRRRRDRRARLAAPEPLERRALLASLVAGDPPILPAAVPGDPRFTEQWSLRNTGQHGGTPAIDIAAVAAWDVTTGSREVVVAVIDSGADLTHPDLIGNLWRNPGETPGNGIDDDGNGFVDDVHGWDFVDDDGVPQDGYGHGTHVAGIIGAVGDDGQGIAGVTWQVSLMILRVQDDRGAGSTSAVLEALEYVTTMRRDHGINVVAVNASWDAPTGYSGVMESILRAQGEAGIVFVAAAGNQGSDVDVTPRYPGGYDLPSVITVAATTPSGDLAGLSNYGATSVDLAAPGTLITSTWPGGRYGMLSGTSMAAPHVTGAIALLAAAKPGLTVGEIRAAVLGGARPVAALAGRTVTGGMLDMRAALAAIGAAPPLPGGGATAGGTLPAAPPVAVDPGVGLPVSDTFATPAATLASSGWRRVRGRMTVQGGAAISRSRGVTLVVREGVTAADVDVRVDFALGRARSIGVVARFDAASGATYRARVVRTRFGVRAQIHRQHAGRWTLVAAGRAAARGQLRFEVVGDRQRLWLDGTVVAESNDERAAAGIAAGGIGLYALGAGGRVLSFEAA